MSATPGGLSRAPSRSAAERARRMLVQIAVGPSRTTVLTAIGSAVVFVAVLVLGYFTRR